MRWFFPFTFTLLSVFGVMELCGRLNQAREQHQVGLLNPLRWQLAGRVLFGLGWVVDGVTYLPPVHADHLLFLLMVILWVVGLGTQSYGYYRGKAAASRARFE